MSRLREWYRNLVGYKTLTDVINEDIRKGEFSLTKIHVLADETLGGTLREYVEVNRKAEIGEKVLFNGQAYEVINRGTTLLQLSEHIYVGHYGTPVLEPTDIVHITSDDGKSSRFRLVDRKAEVGELVIQTSTYLGDLGRVSEVTSVCYDGSGVTANNPLRHCEYRVLEPVETSPQNTDDRDTLSLIANLARRVAELERRDEAQRKLNGKHSERFAEHSSLIYGAKRDVETWAQEVEGLRNDLAGYRSAVEDVDAKVEMCIDDIVTLDERTSESKNVAKSTVKVCDFSIRQSIDGETNVDVTFSGAPSAGNIAEAIRQALGGVRE